MDILPASKSSDWWTVITDNNTITGPNLKDGINGPAFEKLQAQLAKAKTVPEQIGLWQAFLKNPANINATGMPIAKKALNTWMTDGKMPSNVQAALSKDPLAPLPALAQAQLTYDKTDPASVKNYATALKDTYGNLKKADGTPEFTPAYLNSVAAGTIPQDTFDTRINNIAVKAATADLKAQGISLADVGGPEGLASSGKLAEYLNDSTKLASAYTSTPTAGSTVVGGAGNDTVPNEGITALGPYSGSISEVNTPAKMKQVVDNYDPNKGVYRAPSLDASGKLVANSTSPYSNILNGMLSGYKNPYAADYTNQLKMPETPDLTNIKKSFENNPTSKDLLKLANTAGQPYDPNAQTSLSPALSKMYQPSITNSAGKATKPGAPDTTNTTLPVVPKAGEPIVPPVVPPVVNPPVVNPPVVNPPVVNPPVVNPPVVNPPVKTPEQLDAEKNAWVKTTQDAAKTPMEYATALANNTLYPDIAAIGKSQIEQLNAFTNQQVAEKAEADRLAAEKAAVVTTPGKLTFQPVDGVVVSAEERAKNLEAARIAQEALAKRQVEEKTEAERQAGIKTLAEKAEADRLAEVNRLAALARNPDGGPSSLAPINPNTYGPQQVTLNPNTVVSSPSGINALSAQTVTPPPSGPHPINPSNGGPTSAIVGPITAAQRDLGPLNISNLGAVIGPQAMNSNAGGVASLVSPQVTVQPQPQQAVANEPTNDWGVPYSQLRAEAAKSAATNPVVTTPYYSNYD